MIMAQDRHGRGHSMPEEIRAICTGLCRDVAALRLKWDTYLGLLAGPEVAALLSDTAPAFFQVVAESLRNDIVQSICRLGDPSRALGPDNPSLATLVARCPDVPRVEDLLTAFQAACGPVRRHRHRHLGHEDPGERIGPREDLLPDVCRARIDEILLLAGSILMAVHRYYSAGAPDLRPAPVGGVAELIDRIKMVHEPEGRATPSEVERLASVLIDEPARSPDEVFRRCQAADGLAALGPRAESAVPAILRTLVVPVAVDGAVALRVAAAAALWKVSHRFDVAIPFLAWALKDEYWGVAPRAVAVLSEIGHAAVVPDLVRLAERRLSHGPLPFERFTTEDEGRDSEPLLAAVARALGRCAQGRWDGPSYSSEARATLSRLAACGDESVRSTALEALSRLEYEAPPERSCEP
jgi:hypothetical protein